MFNLFKKKIPHCNELYVKYFTPWYPEKERSNMPRPDMYEIAAYEGRPLNLDEIQYLNPEYLQQVKEMIEVTMPEASLKDFQNIIKSDSLNLELLEAVDKFYDRKKINDLIKESDPKDISNLYLVSVCEFGTLLGYLFNQQNEFGWLYSHPYFNSTIVHKETGIGIPVFDWAIKKFSEYGVDDGFVAKFQMALEEVKRK